MSYDVPTSSGDDVDTPIWDTYKRIVSQYDRRESMAIEALDRFDFYEHAKQAYCIIATGESALYANVILQKSVIL